MVGNSSQLPRLCRLAQTIGLAEQSRQDHRKARPRANWPLPPVAVARTPGPLLGSCPTPCLSPGTDDVSGKSSVLLRSRHSIRCSRRCRVPPGPASSSACRFAAGKAEGGGGQGQARASRGSCMRHGAVDRGESRLLDLVGDVRGWAFASGTRIRAAGDRSLRQVGFAGPIIAEPKEYQASRHWASGDCWLGLVVGGSGERGRDCDGRWLASSTEGFAKIYCRRLHARRRAGRGPPPGGRIEARRVRRITSSPGAGGGRGRGSIRAVRAVGSGLPDGARKALLEATRPALMWDASVGRRSEFRLSH